MPKDLFSNKARSNKTRTVVIMMCLFMLPSGRGTPGRVASSHCIVQQSSGFCSTLEIYRVKIVGEGKEKKQSLL